MALQWNNLEETPFYELKKACQERNILPAQKCTKPQLISILIKYHEENPSRLPSRAQSPIIQSQEPNIQRSRSPTPVPDKNIQKKNKFFDSKFILSLLAIITLVIFSCFS